MPWSSLFDSLKKDKRRASSKRKRSIDQTTISIPEDQHQDDKSREVHFCPLCPRTFNLPNSLALHLKWHWGASGLDWKRGEYQ